MEKITMQQFLLRQPSYPEVVPTDRCYLELANSLLVTADRNNLFPGWPESVVRRAALALVGYYQDVIADAGPWHAFISECRRLYGKFLPFFDISDDYMECELNLEDVRFMVWYAMAMNCEERRVVSPFDDSLASGALEWYKILEDEYEEMPMPENHYMTRGLDLHDPEDAKAVYDFGNWLFMNCYLMTPAFAMTLDEIVAGIDINSEDSLPELNKRLEKSMMEDPTGPLALYTIEWLHLIIGKKTIPEKKTTPVGEGKVHPYYEGFVREAGGDTVKFFDSYENMNRFFITALGWAEGEEHLAQVKGAHDYVLMVDREKGMLLARNVARCMKAPMNPYYDHDYACRHAIDLFTVRGLCPADLLVHAASSGWIPDARFPGSDDTSLVADNWDFIARCYLQQYYRGD